MLQDSRIRDFPTEIRPGVQSEGPPIHITIHGSPLEFPPNLTVLEAVENAGIPLPALCHDPRLMPSGNCRLCLVEIEGHERPVASCETRLSEGMQISTHTPELEAGRKAVLELLVHDYPGEALTSHIQANVLIADGETPKVLSNALQQQDAGLLVMGRSCVPGRSGRLGSDAYGIICQAPCPVVSI